jgi:hypothetical protein
MFDLDESIGDDELAALLLLRQQMQDQGPGAAPNTLGNERSPTEDAWRSILGDIFHFIDRIKVGMHHSYKKAFFAAYREAWPGPG